MSAGWALGGGADRPASHPLPPTAFTFHQFSQWLKVVTLPTIWLGVASLTWELLRALWRYVGGGGAGRLAHCRAARAGLTALHPPLRWTQVWGWLGKFCAAVQLFIFGIATAALFLISLVGSTSQGQGRGLKGQL